MRCCLLPFALVAVLIGCGYSVDDLGSQTDLRLQALTEGDIFTFADLTETDCSEVGLVASYASNGDRDSVIGGASVSMEGQDQFTLLVAFDAEGDRLLSARIGRMPYDLDDFGTRRVPCDSDFQVVDGRVAEPS